MKLAESIGWTLPSSDPDEHTLAVMQTAEHLERVAHEAVVDLAEDGVVYAEIRSRRSCTSRSMPANHPTSN